MTSQNKIIDLTGQSFGYWTVVGQAPRRDNKTRWLCVCSTCGAQRSLQSPSLRSGAYAKCFGTHKMRASVPSPLRKAPGYAAATEILNHYRASARRRGLTFGLTRVEFDAITAQDCHYCGAPPGNRNSRRHFYGVFVYNGIDRVDNAQGYVAVNCVPCCAVCNVMKQDLPSATFIAHVHRIASLHQPPELDTSGRMALGAGGNFRTACLDLGESVPDDAEPRQRAAAQLRDDLATYESERLELVAYNRSCRAGIRDVGLLGVRQGAAMIALAASGDLRPDGSMPRSVMVGLYSQIDRRRKRLRRLLSEPLGPVLALGAEDGL